MLAFGHNSIGALIGLSTFTLLPDSTPLTARISLAVCASFISHYLTDRIPHGHYEFSPARLTKKMALLFLLDFGGSMIVLTLCAYMKFGISAQLFVIMACMWAAQLPDIFEGFVSAGVIPFSRLVRIHRNFHFYTMHAKTPHNLLLPDGESRKWSESDVWQIACFLGAIAAIWVG